MIITKDTIDTAKLKEIYINIPPINDNISSSGINAMRALLPVEEHREPIYLLVKKILIITINILNILLKLFKYLVILIILNMLEVVLQMDVVLCNILPK